MGRIDVIEGVTREHSNTDLSHGHFTVQDGHCNSYQELANSIWSETGEE